MSSSSIQGPETDTERGYEVLRIESPFLSGRNRVDVLLPDQMESGRRYPVLYVLPVGGEWGPQPHGNGLDEVKKADLHNRFSLIAVSMEFDTVPWYGAHVSDPTIRHEDYITRVVVPAVEAHFPASPRPEDRLLFGFSKSGWGAVSLLLRNPEVFGYACSWDAPLCFAEKDHGKVGTRKHFGSAEQMAEYLPTALATQHAELFRKGPKRLYIFGRNIWWKHSSCYSDHLTKLGIPHHFDDSFKPKHHWASGWVEPVLEVFLTSLNHSP